MSIQKYPQHRSLPQRFTPILSAGLYVAHPKSVRYPSKLRGSASAKPVMAIHDSGRVYPGPILEASNMPGPIVGQTVVFYTHVLCPFAERVWLTLLEKQVAHTLVQVDLSRKPTWYRSINPRGLVPCVTYEGNSIIESEDICRSGLQCRLSCSVHAAPLSRATVSQGMFHQENLPNNFAGWNSAWSGSF